MAIGSFPGSADEKKQLGETLDAAKNWATNLDIADEAKAKKAIGIFCKAVRDSEINSIDEILAMNFDQFLTKVGPLMGSAKNIMAIYDLDINAMLNSVKLGTPTEKDGKTEVPMTFTAFGKTSTVQVPLKAQNGKWFMND